MLIELAPDGLWRWWNLEEQSGRPSELPFMSGKWFTREQALYLRIEQHREGGSHGFLPGMAIVFDIKSVGSDTLLLQWFSEKEEITWRRILEQGGESRMHQPFGSGTNSTSPTGSAR
jgi:hypothetical protein